MVASQFDDFVDMYIEGFINFPAFPKVFGTGTKEVSMNRRIFFISAFCFLLFALLSAQDTLEEILTIQNPFNDYQFSAVIKEGSGDVNGDGYNDFIITKNDNSNFSTTYEGEVFLFLGKPHLTETPDFIFTSNSNDNFGYNATIAGDINGDGYDDVIISAIYAAPAGAGEVYIYLGGDPFDTEVDYVLNGANYSQVLYINLSYGMFLSADNDFNNDGYDDLVIGGWGPTMSWEGQIDVFLGGDPFDIESDFCLYGHYYFAGYGGAVIGDINGDGFDDFLPGHLENNEYILEIYPGCEDFPPEVAIATLNMNSLGYNGYGVICNDINGDGYDDIIYASSILGDHFIMYISGDNLFSLSEIDSINCYDGGFTNLFASDVNNDGHKDIIISYEFDSFQHYAGTSMIYYGGTLLDSIPDIIMTGSVNYEYFGKVGYDLGDVNGDGNTDILLGSSSAASGTIIDYVTIYTEENLVSAQNETISISKKLYNYPNPFNPSTTIYFELNTETAENTELVIYNLKGQKVKNLSVSSSAPADKSQSHNISITWDGTDQNENPVSSGVYFYQLKAGEKIQAVNKCLLIK